MTGLSDILLAEVVVGAPDWLPIAGIVAAVLVIATVVRNRRDGASSGLLWLATLLKVAGILLLASCLVEPLYRGVRPRPGANAFVILTDDSQSMTVKSGSAVRSEGLKDLLKEENAWRVRLQQDFDVRNFRFDEQLRHVDDPSLLTYSGVGSGLFSALETLHTRFQSRPVAGVLVFTDGNATDAIEREKYDFPIYLVTDKDSDEMHDIRIKQMNVSQTNFETSPVSVKAVIDTSGFSNQNLTARVVDPKNNVIEQQQVDLEPNGQAEFQFRFRPEESGLSFHRLEVFPTSDEAAFANNTLGTELTLANNRRWMTTDRGGGPYRVLYVAGRTNWEFKFLRRALEEDAEIELRGLLRIAKKQPKFSFQDRSGLTDRNQLFEGFEDDEEDLETYDQTVFIRLGVENDSELAGGFPRDADSLFGYHAIILDDIEAKFFSAEQMLLLRRFVNQRGGGLLMLGGAECFGGGGYDKTPLGEVLPVYPRRSDVLLAAIREAMDENEDSPIEWNLTREGWLQDWTRLRASEAAERKRFGELVGLKVVNPIVGLKPGASLMATLQNGEDDPIPALATHRFGKGRSASLLAGDLWRWGMHQKDPQQQDLQQFWRQLVRWLVAEVPVRVTVTAERSPVGTGSQMISVSVRDEQYLPHDNAEVKIEVTTPDAETVELTAEPSDQEPGVYQVDYFPREDGPYRVAAFVKTASGDELPSKEAGWTTQRAAFEFEQLTTNHDVLKEIAQRSKGEVIEADQLDSFVANLRSRQVPVTESWTYPLWHQPWVLGLALACLCGEWGIRRWRGLA